MERLKSVLTCRRFHPHQPAWQVTLVQASDYDELKREGYEQDALLDAKWASDVEAFAESFEDYIAELKGRPDWEKTKERIRLALADGRQLLWDNESPGYLSNSEAIVLINSIYKHARLTLPKLRKMLKPEGTIRFMRKPQRSRVNIDDLKARYGRVVPEKLIEEEADRIADEREAEKRSIDEAKNQHRAT